MKKRSSNNNYFIIIPILSLVNLCVLIYLKYLLNQLSIRNFRIDYPGNVLNIVVSLLFVIGIIIYSFGKIGLDKKKFTLLILFQIIIFICFVLIIAVGKMNWISTTGFLFNFPIKKVYEGFLFILSELLQIYSLLYIWGLLLGSDKLFEVRTLVRTLATVFLLLIFSFFYVWNESSFAETKIEKTKYDYGFVPGAAVWSHNKPSPVFEGRIRKALELYKKGIIEKIILTGGGAPGEITESQAALKYLTKLDVPKEDLTIETQSSTTTEQVKYLRMNFFTRSNQKPIVIISDGFHLSRSIQIAKFFRVNTIGIASDSEMSLEKTLYYHGREGVALLLFWFFAI